MHKILTRTAKIKEWFALGNNSTKNKGREVKCSRDLSGGPVVNNPSSNAGDAGSIPGWGTKIPHAMGQLSLCATTVEFACLSETAHVPQTTEPTLWSLRITTRERKPTCHN